MVGRQASGRGNKCPCPRTCSPPPRESLPPGPPPSPGPAARSLHPGSSSRPSASGARPSPMRDPRRFAEVSSGCRPSAAGAQPGAGRHAGGGCRPPRRPRLPPASHPRTRRRRGGAEVVRRACSRGCGGPGPGGPAAAHPCAAPARRLLRRLAVALVSRILRPLRATRPMGSFRPARRCGVRGWRYLHASSKKGSRRVVAAGDRALEVD
ncbi:MAG: hypothetical protein JWM27_5021 [Gemmatimonadetes bacterium]|nr:hypothetical protein [Gemmatimonadota bacterium]